MTAKEAAHRVRQTKKPRNAATPKAFIAKARAKAKAGAEAGVPEGEPRTLAEVHRQRKDVVSGKPVSEANLIRFVEGPDGEVVPDLGRDLPGRGVWVAATRSAVEQAANKNLFARSAKKPLKAPQALSDLVEQLLMKRALDRLGLARRAGALTSGYEAVAGALASGRAAWLIEAADGADDGRRKLLQIVHRLGERAPRICGVFSAEELGLALGLDHAIHHAFLAGRWSDRWSEDLDRLAGFRPILPAHWGLEAEAGEQG